jgi:hypothetical protein
MVLNVGGEFITCDGGERWERVTLLQRMESNHCMSYNNTFATYIKIPRGEEVLGIFDLWI